METLSFIVLYKFLMCSRCIPLFLSLIFIWCNCVLYVWTEYVRKSIFVAISLIYCAYACACVWTNPDWIERLALLPSSTSSWLAMWWHIPAFYFYFWKKLNKMNLLIKPSIEIRVGTMPPALIRMNIGSAFHPPSF